MHKCWMPFLLARSPSQPLSFPCTRSPSQPLSFPCTRSLPHPRSVDSHTSPYGVCPLTLHHSRSVLSSHLAPITLLRAYSCILIDTLLLIFTHLLSIIPPPRPRRAPPPPPPPIHCAGHARWGHTVTCFSGHRCKRERDQPRQCGQQRLCTREPSENLRRFSKRGQAFWCQQVKPQHSGWC
jgi:hypothetical protein